MYVIPTVGKSFTLNDAQMKFTKLVPNLFYTDIQVGLTLFVDCLDFKIGYEELSSKQPFCVVEKDGLAIHLIQNKEYAEKDRPELRLVTTDIEEVYTKIKSSHPELVHPNAKVVSMRPWGAREFALKDESDVCVIIQQW
ncbi:hypothetical protein GCM10028774_49370 [Spirosoma jeollabukense]